jgi:phytoene synthase
MSTGPQVANRPTLNPNRFAETNDWEVCRRLHKQYGTTYYFATRLLRQPSRRRVDALYAFVRIADECVDNPLVGSEIEPEKVLEGYREQLILATQGVRPEEPVLRAFADTIREAGLSLSEPEIFLEAMRADLTVARYPTYEALRGYMRGSAVAVGLMTCVLLGSEDDPVVLAAASALGEAMQLTNFLRDVGEDARRGRIYLPQEDLATCQVREDEILEGVVSTRFVQLMKFEIARARALYEQARSGVPLLPKQARTGVALASALYERILDRIEENGYDVFTKRARTTKFEKLWEAVKICLSQA